MSHLLLLLFVSSGRFRIGEVLLWVDRGSDWSHGGFEKSQ